MKAPNHGGIPVDVVGLIPQWLSMRVSVIGKCPNFFHSEDGTFQGSYFSTKNDI